MSSSLSPDPMETLLIRTSDADVTLQLPFTCFHQSTFFKALEFDANDINPEMSITAIPPNYVKLAVDYLIATCDQPFTFTDELPDTLTPYVLPTSAATYPAMMTHLFGYLGISSIIPLYQRMILESVTNGYVDATLATYIQPEVLALLSEEELYSLALRKPDPIAAFLELPANVAAARYLQMRLSRGKLAMLGKLPLEIKSRGRLFAGDRLLQTDHPILKVVAAGNYFFFIDDRLRLYHGVLNEGRIQVFGELVVGDHKSILSISTNGKSSLFLTDEGEVYAYGVDFRVANGQALTKLHVPSQLPLDFFCTQVVVGMDRWLFVSDGGQLYSMDTEGIQEHRQLPLVRQVIDGADGLTYLTTGLRVINPRGQTVMQDICVMITPLLYLDNKYNLVDEKGEKLMTKTLTVATSGEYEAYLPLGDGKVRLYQRNIAVDKGMGVVSRSTALADRR